MPAHYCLALDGNSPPSIALSQTIILSTKELKLGVLSKPWTEEDYRRLRELHAARASVARTALALKRRPDRIRAKAASLASPFRCFVSRRSVRRKKRSRLELRRDFHPFRTIQNIVVDRSLRRAKDAFG